MSEEVSKRIDDLHKRFDDLRGDINRRFDKVNERFVDLRADMDHRFEEVNHRFEEVNRRLEGMDQRAAEFRAQVTSEFRELRADMRAHFRWTVTTMVALFGLAVPVWMWVLSLILTMR